MPVVHFSLPCDFARPAFSIKGVGIEMPDVCSVLLVAIFLVAVNPTGVDKKQGDAFVESPVNF